MKLEKTKTYQRTNCSFPRIGPVEIETPRGRVLALDAPGLMTMEIRDDEDEVTGFRRVRVVLFGGHDTARKEPGGWPAGGKGGCNWRISRTPHPFEIKEYEVI